MLVRLYGAKLLARIIKRVIKMTIGNPVFDWNKKGYYRAKHTPKESVGIFTEYSGGGHKILKENGNIETEHRGNCLLVVGSNYFISVKGRYPSYIVGRDIPWGGRYRVCIAEFVKINDDLSGTFKDEQGEFIVTLQRQVQYSHPLVIDMIPKAGDGFQLTSDDTWYSCSRVWRDKEDHFFIFDDKAGVAGFHCVDKTTITAIRNS